MKRYLVLLIILEEDERLTRIKDYIITPYIGEFVNTLTNMIYGSFQPSLNQFTRTKSRSHDAHVVIYGIHGLRRVMSKPEGGLISTLAFPYWGLIGVGVLSAWFRKFSCTNCV